MKTRVLGAVGFVVSFYFALVMGKLFYLLLLVFLVVGIHELRRMLKTTTKRKTTIGYGCLFVLSIFGLAYLSETHIPFLIYITAVLMYDDTFAYLVGKTFGKHKLSSISPNKTIEGSLGGLILSPIFSVATLALLGFIFANNSPQFITFDATTLWDFNPFGSGVALIIASIAMAICGQFGDLFESYLKRQAGIKDSGRFVYGHGGILDRVDSWVFTVIFMSLVLLMISM